VMRLFVRELRGRRLLIAPESTSSIWSCRGNKRRLLLSRLVWRIARRPRRGTNLKCPKHVFKLKLPVQSQRKLALEVARDRRHWASRRSKPRKDSSKSKRRKSSSHVSPQIRGNNKRLPLRSSPKQHSQMSSKWC
jgi:hypothetical protein